VKGPEPTLYLFDGSNLFHAGGFGDRDELVDFLASFVGHEGVRGVVVFDGVGPERSLGALDVRFAPHADDLLEQLAARHRDAETVVVVTSDGEVRWTTGTEVRKLASSTFLREVQTASHHDAGSSRIRDRVDPSVRDQLERMRRGDV
jgi:predicted RNA-binding protein with PIN domain